MSVVVGQTIPFTSEALDLGNTARWNTLFPLIRPSVKVVQTQKGQNIVVDTAKADGKYVHIIAVGTSGNFSSKLLDDKHVTAIVTEERGAGILHATDLPHTLQSAGIQVLHGVVVVRAGKERKVEAHQPDVLEIEVDGELEQDHVLQLLGTATETTRCNPHHISDLLKAFVQDARTTRSKFLPAKSEGNPAILHVDGEKGYDKAQHAVQQDLKHVLTVLGTRKEDYVYSIHYADINGLSRLENYIIAGEIASHLDSLDIQYTLSHSTVLDHSDPARGYSISICPLPTHFLSPKAKPTPHQSTPPQTTTPHNPLSQSTPLITFSDAPIRTRITAACNALIAAEPTITSYDTIVGDGDCGYTLRDGAEQVLSFISTHGLGGSNLPSTLASLVTDLEVNMGGTSGALYCIFLTALASSLASESTVPKAMRRALDELCKYTNARVGDRTMMDALIPFVENLAADEGGNVERALEAAKKGVDGTKTMEAKLGRSTYLNEAATRGVLDPGAYGLLVLLRGMVGV